MISGAYMVLDFIRTVKDLCRTDPNRLKPNSNLYGRTRFKIPKIFIKILYFSEPSSEYRTRIYGF